MRRPFIPESPCRRVKRKGEPTGTIDQGSAPYHQTQRLNDLEAQLKQQHALSRHYFHQTKRLDDLEAQLKHQSTLSRYYFQKVNVLQGEVEQMASRAVQQSHQIATLLEKIVQLDVLVRQLSTLGPTLRSCKEELRTSKQQLTQCTREFHVSQERFRVEMLHNYNEKDE
jgi:hypothetical protein